MTQIKREGERGQPCLIPELCGLSSDFEWVLEEARKLGEVSQSLSCDQMAQFFWTGWEGAVLRAKLEQSPEPLDRFAQGFMALVRGS